MTSDIEMLPLPEKSVIDLHLPTGLRIYAYDTEAMQLYGIAMAEHNVAARDAEIEKLKMEVAEWKASYQQAADAILAYAERIVPSRNPQPTGANDRIIGKKATRVLTDGLQTEAESEFFSRDFYEEARAGSKPWPGGSDNDR